MADNARLTRITGLPRPFKFKSIEDATKAQEELYRALSEWRVDIPRPNQLMSGLFIRPEWYGAVGDGVTDDTAAIQAAIDACNTAGGGTVLFAAKDYAIASGLTLYGNIRYQGQGIAMYHGSGLSDRATVIKWTGGLTGTMITVADTWGAIWDGISLRGNLIESPASTVIGIAVDGTGTTGKSSQRNYFRNFSIYGCDYGIAIAKAYPASSNTDGWVIENFQIYYCNFGIYTGTQNAAYSVIRNGAIYPYDTGIHLYQSGYLKIESVFFGGEVGPTGDGAFIHIEPSTHTIIIENCQSEEAAGITGFKFILFDGLVGKNYPTTLIGCVIDTPVSVANTQASLVLIGNAIENVITVSANDSYVYAHGNVYTLTGTITDSGINNHITKIEYLEASFSENIVATGDIKSEVGLVAPYVHTETIDGADSGFLELSSAGGAGNGRGAYIELFGNENSTNPGEAWIISGAGGGVTYGDIVFAANAVEAVRIDGNTGVATFVDQPRGATSLYRRYYHIPLGSSNPGASGATWVDAGANTTGGWQLNAAGETIRGGTDIHADWDGASDMKVEVRFQVNVDNSGGAAGDTADLKLVARYMGNADNTTKTQTPAEAVTTVGACSRYTMFTATFTLDWDATDNVIEAGDHISFYLNLETDTSEVDDVIITGMSFSYLTTHIGIEDGDE